LKRRRLVDEEQSEDRTLVIGERQVSEHTVIIGDGLMKRASSIP
jgi:hypothetical protein